MHVYFDNNHCELTTMVVSTNKFNTLNQCSSTFIIIAKEKEMFVEVVGGFPFGNKADSTTYKFGVLLYCTMIYV